MTSQHLRLAAGAAVTAAALAACGSGAASSGTGGVSGPAGSSPAGSSPAGTAPAASFNAADVAFATGMLRLRSQAQAMAGLVAGRTANGQLRRFAATVRSREGDAQRMRGLMRQWDEPAPAPYVPGTAPPAGMGPGMMRGQGWRQMVREHGSEFADHWLDVMIANRSAQIALCRTELRSGTSPQARALARQVLARRQAGLAQLRGMHHDREHQGDHD